MAEKGRKIQPEKLRISAVARRAGVSTQTVEYYILLGLIHPQRDGERVREYIGSKPEKIAAALARVQAHRDLMEVLHQAADIRSRLGLVTRFLDAALKAAEGGEV